MNPTVFKRVQKFKSTWMVTAIACLGLSTQVAYAQSPPTDTSFPIQLLKPAPGSSNFLAAESSELGSDMTPSVGIFLSYQHRPFVLLSCDGSNNCEDNSDTIDAVKNLMTLDIMGGFNFLKYFNASIAIPLTLWQHGTGFKDGQTALLAGEEYNAFSIGDVRIHLKARILGKDGKDGPSLAVAVIPSLPIAEWTGLGASDDSTRDGDGAHGYGGSSFISATAPKVMFGYRFGSLRTGISVAANWRKKAEILSTEIGHSLTFDGAIGYSIIPEVELVAEIYGEKSLVSEDFTDSESISLLFLGGGKFSVKDFFFTVGGGGGILSGIGVPQFQIIAGAGWSPQKKSTKDGDFAVSEFDVDGDGIDNEVDECKEQPEDRDGFQDEDGCPDTDNDNDGIVDGYDSCPMIAEDKDGFRDEDGCPDLDHDEDGINEPDDKCPDRAEDFDGFEDEDGCPDLDNDKDGILDADDQCSLAAEDKDGFQDEDGCPDLDNDYDGVIDTKDNCAQESEVLNGVRDNDGCPDRPKAVVVMSKYKIELKEMVKFTGTADTLTSKRSKEILDIVATILLDNTAIKISIEGHTDNKGNAAANKDLSKRRADTIKTYMVKKGVAADRIETKGWGSEQPIESNATIAGRMVNRRIAFIVTQPEGTPADSTGSIKGNEDEGAMDFTAEDEDKTQDMDFTAE